MKINGTDIPANLSPGDSTYAVGSLRRLKAEVEAACALFWLRRGISPSAEPARNAQADPERRRSSRQRQRQWKRGCAATS